MGNLKRRCVWWVSKSVCVCNALCQVCGGVTELPAPRDGEAYKKGFERVMKALDIDISDLFCGCSDHEGAVRKGLIKVTMCFGVLCWCFQVFVSLTRTIP